MSRSPRDCDTWHGTTQCRSHLSWPCWRRSPAPGAWSPPWCPPVSPESPCPRLSPRPPGRSQTPGGCPVPASPHSAHHHHLTWLHSTVVHYAIIKDELTRWQLGVFLVAVQDLVLDKLGEVGQVIFPPTAAAGQKVAPSLVLGVIGDWGENYKCLNCLKQSRERRNVEWRGSKCASVMKTSSVTFFALVKVSVLSFFSTMNV